MGTTLDISPSSRLLPTTTERRQHLKKIGFQKGKSGNKKGRPKLNETVRNIARRYSIEAVCKLIKIMRDPRSTFYLQMQASRAILSMGFHKNESMQKLKFMRVWRHMEYSRLTALGIDEMRANELVEAQCSTNSTIKRFAQQEAEAEIELHGLALEENYAADL